MGVQCNVKGECTLVMRLFPNCFGISCCLSVKTSHNAVHGCAFSDDGVNVVHVAGEMLSVAGPFLEQQMHPTVIIGAFRQALDDLLTILKDQVSMAVDITDRDEMIRIIKSCIGTKFIAKWLAEVMFIFLCLPSVH